MDDNRTTTKTAINQLAQAIGEDPDKIRAREADWTRLMKRGIIVKLHIRRWRAKAKLSFDDLGLYDQDEDQLIHLGEKYLLPPGLIRTLDSIETSARSAIEKRSYETFWGLFIPETAYADWKQDNEYWKARYFAIRDRIYDEYDQNLDQLLNAYRSAAQQAYRRAKALTPYQMTSAERLDESIFINRFLGRLRSMIPSKEAIKRSFEYEEELSFIPLPSLLAADQAEATEIANQANQDYDNRRAESLMIRDVMSKAAEQKQSLIDGFLNDILGQLRGLVYEASTEVLASIKRNGNLQPRSMVQLKNLIDQVNGLNFYGDREIDRMISKLQAIADQPAEQRRASLGDIEGNLRDIALITRSTLLDLGQQPRSPKGQSLVSLGINSKPPAALVRQARHNLDIPITAENIKIERKGRN